MLVTLGLGTGCVSQESLLAHALIRDHLKPLAGGTRGNVLDCRDATPSGSKVANADCAIAALAQHRGFFILYHPQGIDSFVLEGLSGDSAGNVYEIRYDSMGFETDDAPAGITMTEGGHVLIAPCPKPVTLRKAADGILTCRPVK